MQKSEIPNRVQGVWRSHARGLNGFLYQFSFIPLIVIAKTV